MRPALQMAMLALLALPGCAELSYFNNGVAGAIAKPDPGLLPPVPNTVTSTSEKLRCVPLPRGRRRSS